MPKIKKIEFRIGDKQYEIIYQFWQKKGYPDQKIGPFCRQQLYQLAAANSNFRLIADSCQTEKLILELERLNGFMSRALLQNPNVDFAEQIDDILGNSSKLIATIREACAPQTTQHRKGNE